ncbi:hypothetical protein CDD81_2062 [Ophiocordyceps australis]|uniref:Zn(2)-C6 fungal-type domain-containing protein n=1 Tax=Ophiocordyceps australis TaxID=1399860 RepID=A0A2C5XXM1_9HYPO|nr:hypothetical protein CDD81_2062 [Ophiocordyceps australis]
MQDAALDFAAAAAADDAAARRACDLCRLRKIRCDKEWPCANCRTAKRSCTFTGIGQRPKEARQRVLISSQYERKIDQIEARLGSIETLLKSIASPAASIRPSCHFTTTIRTPTSCHTSGVASVASTAEPLAESSEDELACVGDSVLTAQTAFASDFLENAVRRTALRETNPQVESALANLSHLVEMHKRRSISHGPLFPLQRPLPPGGLSKMPLPPVDSVVHLLKHYKNAPPSFFSITCALVGLGDISSICQKVYFATEEFTDSTFTIVTAMLYTLFMEQHSLATDPAVREAYYSYMQMCRVNLETSLANTLLFLSAKIENVQALILGALYAIDVSRPSVAWHLTCMAAQLCQYAGFHRMSAQANDEPDLKRTKRLLFWHTYTLDKGLGLRLGRSSVIHECDIDIPRVFDLHGLVPLEQIAFLPSTWIKISHLQNRIYKELYSPAALECSQEELANRARGIGEECKQVDFEASKLREPMLNYLKTLNLSEVIDMFLKGDEVQFQVTLTLVYRIIPAPEGSVSRFCEECLQVARKAMRLHGECINARTVGSYVQSIYVHWHLFFSPFAPFFVIFCYVIETLSVEDLKLLKDFVASLDVARSSSLSIQKLQRLCHVMCEVAGLYIEARSQQQEDQTMVPIGDEFEMYLSQLGVMPVDDVALAQAQDNGTSMPMDGQVAQIADWYSGSRNMIGLLEEDLSQIEAFR